MADTEDFFSNVCASYATVTRGSRCGRIATGAEFATMSRERTDLVHLLKSLATDSKKVIGYGASTKSNVVLQSCGVSTAEVAAIVEVNPEKFGTDIPIVSEPEAHSMQPDYFLVLPWHFKESIVQREVEFLATADA